MLAALRGGHVWLWCVQACLKRGVLPTAGEAPWPAEPFRSGFLQARPFQHGSHGLRPLLQDSNSSQFFN